MANVIDELRMASRRQPFHTFTIHLSDGGSITVRHPEMVIFPPQGELIVWTPEDIHWVEPGHIARISYASPRRRSSSA